jgi:D-glycero-D-manno-heptose 1,7-bisphosphate phosphatase
MAVNCVIVDRDGTINVDRGYVFRSDEFDYIPGTLEALKVLSDLRIKIYIVTNQAGIAKGRYTEDDFKALTREMLVKMTGNGISIADVLYCPHHPDATVMQYRQSCDCRKPGTALLRTIVLREKLPPESIALIGDKNSDIEAGRSLRFRTYLVETGYGSMEKQATRADFVVKDLKAAVEHLVAQNDNGIREISA